MYRAVRPTAVVSGGTVNWRRLGFSRTDAGWRLLASADDFTSLFSSMKTLSIAEAVWAMSADGPQLFMRATPMPVTHCWRNSRLPAAGVGHGAGCERRTYRVQMWIVKPPGFDAAKKYPLVFWVHGGPQGAWMDSWSTRWNAELWAAQGYVIAMPNPHGSTGFGQKYTDEISRAIGRRQALRGPRGLHRLCGEICPTSTSTPMAAAGASYGGYMMNWFEGHLDKFRCIVVHDGVYNFSSMYGGTEEDLVFRPRASASHGTRFRLLDKFASPHKYAANFKDSDADHPQRTRFPTRAGSARASSSSRRCKRMGIPVQVPQLPRRRSLGAQAPQNSELWHQTIFAWLADYLKKYEVRASGGFGHKEAARFPGLRLVSTPRAYRRNGGTLRSFGSPDTPFCGPKNLRGFGLSGAAENFLHAGA